jgi:hypothetical protein
VGRNAAIKRFSATPAGQPLELFDEARGRMPAILELLASPWIMRASQISSRGGSSAVKHAYEPLSVVWDARTQRPSKFTRGDREYRIEAIVQSWAVERAWWDPRARVSRRFWRVAARGGVYDIAYDRDADSWLLMGIQD